MIVTGEASADEHAAALVTRLKTTHPEIQFSGMGGKKMAAAGVDILVDSTKMAVIGFFELLQVLRLVYHALQTIKTALRTQKPDLLILIDYAGFNLKIAKFAHTLGIQVLYYISPQVWASRAGRVKKIQANVDMMAVIFPFERIGKCWNEIFL
jgi:lipid-A-disaccharide synthase